MQKSAVFEAQRRLILDLHSISTKEFMTILEDIVLTRRIIAFERYNFICSKQKKTESPENFQAELVDLALRVDCGDRENERFRDTFTAHLHNHKIAEELLAVTEPTEKNELKYAIHRENEQNIVELRKQTHSADNQQH